MHEMDSVTLAGITFSATIGILAAHLTSCLENMERNCSELEVFRHGHSIW